MKIRKNFFYLFAVMVYVFCLLFAIVCVFSRLGEGQEYPYLLKGYWLIGMFASLIILLVVWAVWSRLDISTKLAKYPKLLWVIELLIMLCIVIAGSYLRYRIICELPMAPESDYKTYYEMAVMIHDGTLLEEGVGYCDYVAMFPHVYGYPAVLAWFFKIVGPSVYHGQIFNLIVSIGSIFLVWGISRLIRGRFAAFISLVLWAFLPSVILYSNFVASEPFFTFVLLLSVLLFVLSLKETERKEKNKWLCVIELVLLGFTLAFGSFIRPMAMIFLVAAILCMLPMVRKEYDVQRNDVPLGVRAVDSGWKRCLIVLVVYFGFSKLFTIGTSYAVNRELAGSSASFGYNLMTGLNLESYGGWNQEDADYLSRNELSEKFGGPSRDTLISLDPYTCYARIMRQDGKLTRPFFFRTASPVVPDPDIRLDVLDKREKYARGKKAAISDALRYLERIEKYRFYYAGDTNINTEGSDGNIPDSSGSSISDIDTDLKYVERKERDREKIDKNEPETEDVLMQGEEDNDSERDSMLEEKYGDLLQL